MPKDYTYKMTRACALCGVGMWQAPDGAATPVCRPCRRANPIYGPRRASSQQLRSCVRCGGVFVMAAWSRTRFCSIACSAAAQSVPRGGRRGPTRGRRDKRESLAPGLSAGKRRALLRRWRAQGRKCVYCGTGGAETVDHVVPLARGGHHYEGNLAPSCRKCNSSKCDLLLVEWRNGRKTAATMQAEWRAQPKRARKPQRPAVQQVMQVCGICMSLYVGTERTTCGDQHCQREHLGRWTRDRYRAERGHLVDPTEPTIYWIRLHGLPDTRTRVKRKAVAA